MTDTFMQYENEDTGLVARWHGGEYIELGGIAGKDLGPFNNLGQPSYSKGEFVAWDVINVWDHKNDCPRIPRTLAALAEEVEDHIKNDEEYE
jgi:hypothetical protein